MSDSGEIGRKPNWVLLKEAAESLYRSGKIYFTRKELIEEAKKKDPSRSDMSLDFEIDLVTVNSSSKDKYKDPDKLFLFRLERGKYTLYSPEEHGELEKYVGAQRVIAARRRLVEEVASTLENLSYDVSINRTAKPMEPDMIAEKGEDVKVGIWLIDPSAPLSTQYRYLAYIIGSCLLNRNYTEYIILVPGELYKRIPHEIADVLARFNSKIAILKEERRYSIQF
ncbi:MAG: hypothetical protein QXJ16_00490 [Desulfurococcaceae archaeon]|jgi:hypothetical protein